MGRLEGFCYSHRNVISACDSTRWFKRALEKNHLHRISAI